MGAIGTGPYATSRYGSDRPLGVLHDMAECGGPRVPQPRNGDPTESPRKPDVCGTDAPYNGHGKPARIVVYNGYGHERLRSHRSLVSFRG